MLLDVRLQRNQGSLEIRAVSTTGYDLIDDDLRPARMSVEINKEAVSKNHAYQADVYGGQVFTRSPYECTTYSSREARRYHCREGIDTS